MKRIGGGLSKYKRNVSVLILYKADGTMLKDCCLRRKQNWLCLTMLRPAYLSQKLA
jgi:hypothetical protein